MDTLKRIVTSKPRTLLILTAVYIIVLGVLKWKLSLDIGTLLYLIGGALGIYFLDFAEFIFNVRPSPFRSIVFLALYLFVSFFVVTSSGNMFAIGIVLSMFLQLVFLQVSEWNSVGNLDSWYRMTDSVASRNGQIAGVFIAALVLIIESVMFIR